MKRQALAELLQNYRELLCPESHLELSSAQRETELVSAGTESGSEGPACLVQFPSCS